MIKSMTTKPHVGSSESPDAAYKRGWIAAVEGCARSNILRGPITITGTNIDLGHQKIVVVLFPQALSAVRVDAQPSSTISSNSFNAIGSSYGKHHNFRR